MRRLSGLPLDDDILDRILLCSTSFDSLWSTILVSKAFHSVYSAHPTSIVRAVAYNMAGPALPQLLTFIRASGRLPIDLTANHIPAELTPADVGPITDDEVKEISRQASVAKELEDIFSIW